MNRYVVVNWNYAELLCRKVAIQILEDSFKPDTIVAPAKGGWFASMVLSDYLGVEVTSIDLKKKERVSTGKALIVDDFINTGKTMKRSLELVKADVVKTCALMMLQASEFVPDYLGEYVPDDVWVIFPWNFVEDISAIILAILEGGEKDYWEIKNAMLSEFNLDPINLEMAQPYRLDEILHLLEKRKLVEKFEDFGKKLWRLRR
ncbi:MAG: phosphoribosyltransferase [Archaeoglobaceae archaeon]|nr:phosphoribosyltransferase [Archaeoglobaceae archaeon]